jgi:hypothetical protein
MSDIVNYEPLDPVYSPEQLLKFQTNVQVVIRRGMTSGVDYGQIPGTKNGPPALFKAGAEKLCISFGLRPDYEIVERTVDHVIELIWEKNQWEYDEAQRKRVKVPVYGKALGLYRYVIKCTLRDRSGTAVAAGLGLCSTTESKYCDRPRDLENTILKMAQKRAFVSATLNAFGISGAFTTDLDEETEIRSNRTLKQSGFDRNNKAHQEAFLKLMEKHNVPLDRYDDVALKLHGKPSSELEACIKAITGGHAVGVDRDHSAVGTPAGVSAPLPDHEVDAAL